MNAWGLANAYTDITTQDPAIVTNTNYELQQFTKNTIDIHGKTTR